MNPAHQPTGKQIVTRLGLRILLAVSVTTVAAYATDAIVVRLRNPKAAYSTVTVRQYYAIPLKSKKSEIQFADPQDVTCTNSLFPQMGYTPCWYLSRHKQQQLPDQ